MAKRVRKQSEYLGTCLFCGTVVKSQRNLQDHYFTHTNERPYSCSYCDSTFRNNSVKIQHEKNIHLRIKYNCDNCSRFYNEKSNLENHRKTCKGGRGNKYHQKLQSASLRNIKKKNVKLKWKSQRRVFLPNHKLKSEPKSVLEGSQPYQQTKSYNKQLSLSEDLDKYPEYIWTHNGPPLFPPPLPSQLLQIKNEDKWDPMFFLHMNRYKEEDSIFSSNFQITSDNTQPSLQNVPSSPTPKTRVRKIKNQTVKKKSRNIGQKLIKTEITKLKREPVESEKIESKVNWTITGEIFTCPQCGKTFPYRGNLVRHAKIHDGDKPFICRFCNKGFAEKCNVIRHIISMHQNVQQDSSSNAIANPNQTTKVKYSKKQFRCGFCGDTRFKDIRHIYAHISSDHNELLYVEKI